MIAVLPEGVPAPIRVERLSNDVTKLRRLCERLAAQGEVRAYYEAGGASYVLHRAMREWGYRCDVIAPSLIPTKQGQQRKHDKYDAAQLARLYRASEKFLPRRGFVYRDGTNWRTAHCDWLRPLAAATSPLECWPP